MRYSGVVGFLHQADETPPNSGIWKETVVQRRYRGTMRRRSISVTNNDSINPEINLDSLVSVVGDTYAFQNYVSIRYIFVDGIAYKVLSVTPKRPRLEITFGGEYHGPVATETT